MQVEFKKQYLDEYDLRPIVKAVYSLFEDYNYKKAISQEYLDAIYQHRIVEREEYSKYHKKSDSMPMIVEKRENVVKYLEEFDRKLNHLLSMLSK